MRTIYCEPALMVKIVENFAYYHFFYNIKFYNSQKLIKNQKTVVNIIIVKPTYLPFYEMKEARETELSWHVLIGLSK